MSYNSVQYDNWKSITKNLKLCCTAIIIIIIIIIIIMIWKPSFSNLK
jgi:t-SNARE complex subunit (syntaxin)